MSPTNQDYITLKLSLKRLNQRQWGVKRSVNVETRTTGYRTIDQLGHPSGICRARVLKLKFSFNEYNQSAE